MTADIKNFACMLAPSTWPSHNDLPYPCFIQPKVDGIRAVIINKVCYSRNGKPIRNKQIQKVCAKLPNWTTNFVIDGEWYSHGNNFNEIQSVVMDSDDDLPLSYQHVSWDIMGSHEWQTRKCSSQYVQRLQALTSFHKRLHESAPVIASRFQQIETSYVGNPFTFSLLYADLLSKGFEGGMIKSTSGLHKWGRATLKEGTLIKYKPQMTLDLPITAVEEGSGKRSGMVGAFVVSVAGKEIRCGAGKGVDDALMIKLWKQRNQLVGKTLEIYHGGVTADGSFRFPKYLAVREDK